MSHFIIPPFLKSGDTVGIVSTARAIDKKEIASAIQTIQSWGLNVKLGSTIGKRFNQFAGTDKERADDLNEMINDHTVQAIICARGGYGTVRIIDQLDLQQLKIKPKWISGYSDITVLHAALNSLGMASIHSSMPINFQTNTSEALNSIKDAWFGHLKNYSIEADERNRPGNASGTLIGGNLSVLYSIFKSDTDYNYDQAILFIEDLDEYLYHIDRMFMNLNRNGYLKKIKGLIVGGMTEMNDNEIPYGESAKEIIEKHVSNYNFPVCYNFPIGHIPDNRSVYVNTPCELDISDVGTNLLF